MSTQPPDDRPDIFVPHWWSAVSLAFHGSFSFTLTYLPLLLWLVFLAQTGMSAFEPDTTAFWLQFCWQAQVFLMTFWGYNMLHFMYIYSRPVHITYQDAEGEEAPAKDDGPATPPTP